LVSVVTVETPQLGNRAYLVHDGRHGLVIDPPRDIDRIEATVTAAGVQISAVAETHVHNDYVSGGPALARRHRADYVVAAAERVAVDSAGVRGGDVFDVGDFEVVVVETPGHTPHHLAYLARAGSDTAALFSGGSLLHGTVGRTDLSGPENTEALSRAQYRSARRLVASLPPETALYPTHGFGSFCASTTPAATGGSLADERTGNTALAAADEDAFVEQMRDGLGPVPRYYAHMAALNRSGHALTAPDSPRRLDPDQVLDAIRRGAWVVDLRDRREFATAHMRGSVSFEYGDSAATYVGWLVPWGSEVVLLADSEDQLSSARRDLARIGLDQIVGTRLGLPATERAAVHGYPCCRWEDLLAAYQDDGADPQRPNRLVVLDVRQRAEYEAGHLPGAVSLPVQDVLENSHLVPAGTVWVHCRSGYRAAVAASLLHSAGRSVRLLDDDWDRAAAVGLPVATTAA
jgi:hydroxyacylglutathione hydrolase